MRHLRAVFRLLFLTLWTFLVVLCAQPFWVVLFFGEAAFMRTASRVSHIWSKGMLFFLGVKRSVDGTPPARGTFATSNHMSHLDIMAIGSLYPTNFIAKVEISGWPIIGFMARVGGTIWVNREQARDTVRLREKLGYLLRKGCTITMFAEGTSGRGDVVNPFKPPLFEAASQLGTPCVPVSVTYRTPGDGPGPAGPDGGNPSQTVCWWGDMTFLPHYWRMLGLSRIEARVRFGEPVTGIADRKELAAECHRRVEAIFDPVPQ